MEDTLPIEYTSPECPDAFLTDHIVLSQMDAEINLLYGTSGSTIHFDVSNHPATYCPLLLFDGILVSLPQ